MKLPRTQRALACYDTTGGFEWVETAPPEGYEAERYTPVVVIPEAAVKRCKHARLDRSCDVRICRDCGAWSWWEEDSAYSPGDGYWSRWHRPKLLRVQR